MSCSIARFAVAGVGDPGEGEDCATAALAIHAIVNIAINLMLPDSKPVRVDQQEQTIIA
jgi:hypothetical protein